MRITLNYHSSDALIVQHLRIHILNHLHPQFAYLQG